MAILGYQRALAAAAAGAAAFVAACGGGGEDAGSVSGGCTATAQKNFVRDVAEDWYLFPETLPASIDSGAYATAADFLDALTATARAQNRDRFFSYVTTPAADSSFLQAGQFVGFGFRTRIEGDRLYIPEVYEGSPAEDGGLARGAEITHIDSGSGYVAVAAILQADPDLEQAFGAASEGVQRGLRFVPVGGQSQEAVLVKRIVTIAPVPPGSTRILALPSNPAVPVGYVNLRTFISTAEAPLRNAYAQFRAQGVQYFVVDLRYNGGGLVGIADLVGDLNGDARAASDVFENMRFNAARSGNDSTRRFIGQPQSVDPVRIAFITTGGTASASELVVNAMKPWAEVAIVGDDTYGKPVGQTAFDLNGCNLRLRLVTFRITNADGEGDYYEGLADTLPFACAAADDLTRDPWDPAESSLAEALGWLGTGACSDTLAAPGPAFLKAGSGRRIPRSRRPEPAQAWLPGLY